MDGDGLLDIIVDNANVVCDDMNGCISCPVDLPCSASKTNYQPAVWINRFNLDGSGGWEFHKEYSGLPGGTSEDFLLSFNPASGHDVTMADIDGDGKADIVSLDTIRGVTQVDIYRNQGLAARGGSQSVAHAQA